jgi:hypothetical protein
MIRRKRRIRIRRGKNEGKDRKKKNTTKAL